MKDFTSYAVWCGKPLLELRGTVRTVFLGYPYLSIYINMYILNSSKGVFGMETMKRSTRKSGRSIITTLPPEVLTMLNIQVGDKVEFILKDDRVEIRKAVEDNRHMDITEDCLNLVQGTMAEYDEALRGLLPKEG